MIIINKFKQITTISCECCNESFITSTPVLTENNSECTWYRAITELSNRGWKMKLNKTGDKWETYCDKDRKYS